MTWTSDEHRRREAYLRAYACQLCAAGRPAYRDRALGRFHRRAPGEVADPVCTSAVIETHTVLRAWRDWELAQEDLE